MGSSCCVRRSFNQIETDMKFKETEMNEEEKEKEKIKKILKTYILQKNEYKRILENYHQKIDIILKDIHNEINVLGSYKTIKESLFSEFNENNNKLKISLNDSNNSDDINKEDKELILNEFTNTTNKIYEQIIKIENLEKNEIEIIKNIFNSIKQNLDKINENENHEINCSLLNEKLEVNSQIISNKLSECENLINNLESKKNLYNYINNEIASELKEIEIKIKEYEKKLENAKKSMNTEEQKIEEVTKESTIVDNSMLLSYKISNDLFSSQILFDEEKSDNSQLKGLLRKNWNETVYIYNEYDLHEINFDLTAINIPEKAFYDSYNLGFNIGKKIEIIELKIEGKNENFDFENNLIKFNIHLGNMESNKIFLKYKELPLIEELTEDEVKERKFFRNEIYGLSKKLQGLKAKFTLNIKCDFEVINFEEEFLIKTNDKIYTWGGIVPQEGKRTVVILSKLEAKFSFNIYKKIERNRKQPISKLKFLIPLCFEGGNNKIIKIKYSSNQTDQIQLNKEKKECEINFTNIEQNFAEFSIEGELINRCKGEWECDLTDEEIENEIPEDFKTNKLLFKEKAESIIENYNLQHKDDLIKISDLAKIGKWIKKNIQYDDDYIGKNDITASETLENKKGVCDHFTKLYNAFLYSLGYKCIYVSGYVTDKRDIFEKDDYHCWTLVKVNEKWLPFDATWGIFSGKLPVNYIFERYFSKGINTKGNKIKFVENKTFGKYLEE